MSIQSPIRPNIALAVSAPLLYLLKAGPVGLQTRLLKHLPNNWSKAKLTTFVKWLFALGAASQINALLNAWARANWLLNKGRGEKFGARGWSKEIVVITGGSSGIGNATAKGLAAKGLQVCVLDIIEPAEQVPNIFYFKCDVTSSEQVNQAADAVRSHVGQPTVLINNAGIAHAHTMLDASPAYLRKLFDINVLSHFYTLQAFLPNMIKEKKGHVVNIASLASYVGPPSLVDYAASKAAALALHEGLTSELKHRYDAPEILTTVVQPLYVSTALIDTWKKGLRRNKRAVVLKPQTVANAIVAQILSGKSGWIHLPGWMGFAGSLVRALPWWLQEVIRDDLKNDAVEDEAVKS